MKDAIMKVFRSRRGPYQYRLFIGVVKKPMKIVGLSLQGIEYSVGNGEYRALVREVVNMFNTVIITRLIDQKQTMVSIELIPKCIELKVSLPDIGNNKLVHVFIL
jgi:hypothetical protein